MKANRQRCNFQRQGHRNHWGHELLTNQQSTTCWRHWIHLTARTLRQCPIISAIRRPTPSDALQDERANEEITTAIRSEREQMMLNHENIVREQEGLDYSTNNSKPKSEPSRITLHKQRATRKQHISESPCPRQADPEADCGGQATSAPNPNYQHP